MKLLKRISALLLALTTSSLYALNISLVEHSSKDFVGELSFASDTNKPFCHAFGISEYQIVTAKHCIDKLSHDEISRLRYRKKYQIISLVVNESKDLAVLTTKKSLPGYLKTPNLSGRKILAFEGLSLLPAGTDELEFFTHPFQTKPGSSGTPIVDFTNPAKPDLVGVHLGEFNGFKLAASNIFKQASFGQVYLSQLVPQSGFGDCAGEGLDTSDFDWIKTNEAGNPVSVGWIQIVEGKKYIVSTSFSGCSPDNGSIEDESSGVVEGGFIAGNFVMADAPGRASNFPEGTLIANFDTSKGLKPSSYLSKKLLQELEKNLKSEDQLDDGCSSKNSKLLKNGSCSLSYFEKEIYQDALDRFKNDSKAFEKSLEGKSLESSYDIASSELEKVEAQLEDLNQEFDELELNPNYQAQNDELEKLEESLEVDQNDTTASDPFKTPASSELGRKIRKQASLNKEVRSWLQSSENIKDKELRLEMTYESDRALQAADTYSDDAELSGLYMELGYAFTDLAVSGILGPFKSAAELAAGGKNLVTGEDYTAIDYTIAIVDIASLGTAGLALKSTKAAIKATKAVWKFFSKNKKIAGSLDESAKLAERLIDVVGPDKIEGVLDSAKKVPGLADDVSDLKKFAEVSTKYGKSADLVGDSLKSGKGLFGNLPKVARETLTEGQAKNLKRFEKKLPAGSKPTTLHKSNGEIVFQGEVPGNIPGSKAIYEKVVDGSGKTVSYTKTTYAPDGKIIHIKDKIDGSVIVPE